MFSGKEPNNNEIVIIRSTRYVASKRGTGKEEPVYMIGAYDKTRKTLVYPDSTKFLTVALSKAEKLSSQFRTYSRHQTPSAVIQAWEDADLPLFNGKRPDSVNEAPTVGDSDDEE